MDKEKDKAFEQRYLKQIGDRIRAIRKAQGFENYEQYSYHIDFNRSQLNRYENGQNARLGTLFRLLSKMGITPPEFFADGFDWSEFFPEKD